ncbi:MAG TPA: relaxase/mobilization nuclease domain-containing protein [Candidatus Eubacterium faecipullorum]|uniref:Relaxase/mobilization nuclease domain-containing protein n=1 Tax=Candidatus Eubacterium faecipullorum TaxID=2838571 RepID=A0A9D1RCF1_9FIRM|nr:relaxase/mobilization nuclease domain-containing protein [Candidatus Eubacterium faecipullorum]
MAIIKFTSGKINPRTVINYVCNKEKTTDKLISGKDCMPESCEYEFAEVKKAFGKTDGRTYYHMIQSFSPDDRIIPEQAHKVGLQMAELFEGYQVLVVTHTNKAHTHNHLVINSVNFENGKKLTISNQELERIKNYSNSICLKNGWDVTEAKTRRNRNPKWKQIIIEDALAAMVESYSMDEYISKLKELGIYVSYNPDYKYMTYSDAEGHKCRDAKLFDERLLKKNLELYFDLGGAETLIGDTILDYETPKSGNCTDGLTNLITNFIDTIQADEEEYDDTYYIHDRKKLEKIVEKMRARGSKITLAKLIKILDSKTEQEETYYFGW